MVCVNKCKCVRACKDIGVVFSVHTPVFERLCLLVGDVRYFETGLGRWRV